MRKNHLIIMLGVFPLFLFNQLFASTLLTQEEALKQMFPDADEIVTETVNPSELDMEHIKARLGGQLVHHQKGSESEEVAESNQITFFYGMKGGQKIGVAIIDEQPGKWGPVQYILMLDAGTAKMKNLAVMAYKEKRGRPIARNSFLKQFVGKGSADPIQVRKDIRAISGATISSDATCFAVKKAIAVVEVLLLKLEA